MTTALIWAIAAATIACILLRPKGWPEAVWALLGAALLTAGGLLPGASALHAVGRGADVYLFLTGMMLLSELARRDGVFNWLAGLAVNAAKGSRHRLFFLIYLAGVVVTVLLSNDATAVVLTPAVYAAVKKAGVRPLPYLLICAFVANAASFVLPISNPANLVVYGKTLPPLLPWLRTFLLPSICSIAATYALLRWMARDDLRGTELKPEPTPKLSEDGRRALWGIALAGAVLITASAAGSDLGLPTCLTAIIVVLAGTRGRWREIRSLTRSVSWSVLPMVAGLFVVVEALDSAGGTIGFSRFLQWCLTLPLQAGTLAAAGGVAIACNIMNNLPMGLLAGAAVQTTHLQPAIRDSVLIGVDLGPNLSVTGSLATLLWLIVLRREGEHVPARQFLRAGLLVMPPALILATLAAGLH